MTALRPTIALAATAALAAGATGALAASSTDYRVRTFEEPASHGLAVKAPLDAYLVVGRARLVVPTAWRTAATSAGHAKFTLPNAMCTFDVTFTVRSVIGDAGTPADRVTTAVPAAGSRYVLDEGQRLGSAFRVVRAKSSGGRVVVNAQRSAILTRRSDIAPSGKVVWSDISVVARSRAGDECHSGTWRERLGPQLADVLATAKTNLRFVKK